MTQRKIIFRADASPQIGYGHFVRTLALSDMLRGNFHLTFATRHPTAYQKGQMEAVCDEYVALGDNHFSQFLELLAGDEIVVLDNYFFDTDYQRKIRDKGCAVVCVDDTHSHHYVADVVINHGFSHASLFSVEPYTKLCLGLDYALLRRPFLTNESHCHPTPGHCVVAFGGVDTYNITQTVAAILSDNARIAKITAVVGDAYAAQGTLEKVSKVDVRRNLSAQQMADLFRSVEFAVLPASTISLEAIACGCPVVGGYYVDNQIEGYHAMVAQGLVAAMGDWSAAWSKQELQSCIDERKHPQIGSFALVPQRYINLFKQL